MKKLVLAIFLMATFAASTFALNTPFSTISFSVKEKSVRFYPDGSIKYDATTDWDMNNAPVGNCFKNICWFKQAWYNYALPDLKTNTFIVMNWVPFHAEATYTSPVSGLPIKDVWDGILYLNTEKGTMSGGYYVKSYAMTTDADAVNLKYAKAVCDHYKRGTKICDTWFIGLTQYIASHDELV